MFRQYNVISDFLHQPQEAFLFLPYRSNDDQLRDDFKIGGGNKIRRLIFEGWAEDTYTQYEREELQKFEDYLAERKVVLDERWDRPWKLRYLLSTGLDREKCVEDMGRFVGHLKRVRELHFSRSISKLLGEGIFYVGGKDSHYRPIIVYNVEKIVALQCTDVEVLEAQIYLLEYVIEHYLIPGQVENWIALVDSGRQGLFSMLDSLKNAFTFLADNYRARLFAGYNVRITTSISMIWKVVKNFLDPETIEKINLFDQNVPEPLFEYCNPSQLEVKFGGTLPNIPEGSFWPPREWSSDYKCSKSPVKYMTREQYTKNYNEGILRNTKIHEEIIITPRSTELRENPSLDTLKKIEREFRIELESCCEDSLSFEKDIEPFSKFASPLAYSIPSPINDLAKI